MQKMFVIVKTIKGKILPATAIFSIGMVLGAVFESIYDFGGTLKAFLVYRSNSSTDLKSLELSTIPSTYQGKVQLFVLAGQSNMSGLGELPSDARETNSQIYVFGNDYRWKLAKEPLDDATGQVDAVSIDTPAGYSPALSFATALLKHYPDIVIGLIPCAKGGSSIHEWQRNLSDNTLYGSCLKRIKAASTQGEVAGVLYFQGEIDALNPQEVPEKTLSPYQWAEEFTLLINSWRSDLNYPNLPIVFAQIGSHTEPDRFIHWEIVKEQQSTVQLPFTTMITTDDLALQDYVHFTTESYRIIGQRFANAYLSLVQTEPQ